MLVLMRMMREVVGQVLGCRRSDRPPEQFLRHRLAHTIPRALPGGQDAGSSDTSFRAKSITSSILSTIWSA